MVDIKIFVAAIALIVGLASTVIFKKAPDNPVEQFSEKILKETIGLDIDLTPDKKEGN